MAPYARDRPELGFSEMLQLGLVVGDAEIEIGRAREQQHFRGDGPQRTGEVAAMERIVAHVAMLPGERLRVEIGCPPQPEAIGPVRLEESVEIGRAERLAMQVGAVEILAETPAGIDMAESLERERRLVGEASPAEMLGRSRVRRRPERNTLLCVAVRALPHTTMARSTISG